MTFSWNPVIWSFLFWCQHCTIGALNYTLVETRPSQLLICLGLYSHALFISAAWISGRPRLPTPNHQYLTSWEWDSASYKLLPSAVFVFVWNAGSPSYVSSAWLLNSRPFQGGSRRNSETEAMDAAPHSLVFQPPELPEDTLLEVQANTVMILWEIIIMGCSEMHTNWYSPWIVPVFYLFFSQQSHTDALTALRFTLAFVLCVMELASSKDPDPVAISSPDVSFLEQSLVTDQISLLSKEWR